MSYKLDNAPGLEEYARGDWDALNLDKSLFGRLNEQLRQQIEAGQQPAPAESTTALTDLAGELVEEMLQPELDRPCLEQKLEALYSEKIRLYAEADIPRQLRKRQYICQSGLVISPDHCVTTLRDTLRVRGFIRAIDKALRKLKRNNPSGVIRIAYPACGPFAPLLLPLLSYYKSSGIMSSGQLKVTLVDIQEGAVQSLEALVDAFQLQGYIEDVVCCDAVDYEADAMFDMVVLEAMQHGFSREGHLRIASHFARLLKEDGFFIPRTITIGAMLSVAQREYVEQWNTELDEQECHKLMEEVRHERTDLGTILTVTAESLRNSDWQILDAQTRVMECATVKIPHLEKDANKQTLSIYSGIEIFEGETLGEYESGITHPLPDLQICVNFEPSDPQPGDLLVESGDSLTFYYCINGLPGFLAAKAQDNA